MASPLTTEDGTEAVVALLQDGKYTLIPVTVENGAPPELHTEAMGARVDSLTWMQGTSPAWPAPVFTRRRN